MARRSIRARRKGCQKRCGRWAQPVREAYAAATTGAARSDVHRIARHRRRESVPDTYEWALDQIVARRAHATAAIRFTGKLLPHPSVVGTPGRYGRKNIPQVESVVGLAIYCIAGCSSTRPSMLRGRSTAPTMSTGTIDASQTSAARRNDSDRTITASTTQIYDSTEISLHQRTYFGGEQSPAPRPHPT